MFSLALTGCGGGEESLDGLGTFGSPSTNNGNGVDDPVASNEINLRVEATTGMRSATVSQRLFDFMTPAKAFAIDAGSSVSADIKVRHLSRDGEVLYDGVIDEGDYFIVDNENGTYTIVFDGSSIPNRMDLAIIATLSNGTVLRRGLPNTAEGIVINAATEYAVQQFYSSFSSQSELDNLLSCTSGCDGQSETHMLNWLALNNAVMDFEITIPDDYDLDEAIDLLDSNSLVQDYVDQFIDTIKETKVESIDNSTIAKALSNRSGNYNSVLFAMGLNQGLPDESDADNKTVVFSNQTSDVLTNTASDVTSYIYPKIVISTSILSFNPVLIEQVPWSRTSLTQLSDNTFDTSSTIIDTETNRQEGTVFTFLSPKGHFDMARLQTQTITQETSASPTGWLNNPFFTRYYSTKSADADTETSEGIASAYISDGLVFRLSENSNGKYDREETLEKSHTFGWLYSLKMTDSDDFDIETLDEADYGVVSLTQKLETTNPMELRAGIEQWSVNGSTLQVTQPTLGGGDPEIFKTYETGRNSDLSANAVSIVATNDGSYNLSAIASPSNINTGSDKFTGRVQLNNWNSAGDDRGDWTGASDPLGNILVLRTNSEESGQGIAHAVKISKTNVSLAGNRYYLFGNSFQSTDMETVLSNFNLSTLEFDSSSNATLTVKELKVAQTIGDQILSETTNNSAAYTTQPTTSPASNTNPDYRNLLKLEFSDPTGGADNFILEGFVGSEGKVLVLLMRYGQHLGLLYGFLEQELTASSE
ncbi:hypothetical protein BTA51_25635 [Hahella sp. CCB-MM4]|uniref:hypothetical protein n=1 Tax=Hahella sp. (strain CCB-MM4) TaxID=1926491 RepID=UPI000B9A83A5|nr:hypothetical protein [Hahella sp. CCB-MM4]OZG70518.1 hypothetical protein BTA51_25635 [Hahella sp. CCB-MM4]